MLNFKSLVVVAAISTVAMMSIALAASTSGRKTVHQPKIFASEMVRGNHAEFRAATPAVSDTGYRVLPAPAGR